MKIQLLDLAKADLIEGYHFYEDREAGLGDYFLDNLYLDIDSLALFGGLHSMSYRHFQALSVRDFLHGGRRHRKGKGCR